MTTELAAARPARAEAFDISRLPTDLVKGVAAQENWGDNDVVLRRYLGLHVPLAIEQGRYVWNGKEIVMRAGHLATAAGAAVYLGLAQGSSSLNWAAERPTKVEALLPTDLGAWPELDPRREVVVVLDQFRAKELAGLTLNIQNQAVAGAVEWSIRRSLAVRQVFGEERAYFVPVHLTNREGAPELVAAVHVQSKRLVVRTFLDPRTAYLPARIVVERREQLPGWLLDA